MAAMSLSLLRQLGSDNVEATTWKRPLGSDNVEAATWKRQRGSGNVDMEATLFMFNNVDRHIYRLTAAYKHLCMEYRQKLVL